MKKLTHCIGAAALCLWLLPASAHATRQLVPVGQVVGLELRSETVTVAAFHDTLGAAARDAGLQIGDEILDIDGDCGGFNLQWAFSSAQKVANVIK